MSENKLLHTATTLYTKLVSIETLLQSPLLLIMRLYWGWQFFNTGKGKLMHLDKTTEFFASLNLPAPYLNAMMAGSVECIGGLLLLLGLGSRLITIPLTFTMIVAYLTAHREELMGVFSNPDGFIEAAPFLFMLTAVIVLAFGPGIFSVDALIKKYVFNNTNSESGSKA